MATVGPYPIPATTLEAGANSAGPASFPAGYAGVLLELDLTSWTAADTIAVTSQFSYDGGATWLDGPGATFHGGMQTTKGGTSTTLAGVGGTVPRPGTAGQVRGAITVPSPGQTSGRVTLYS